MPATPDDINLVSQTVAQQQAELAKNNASLNTLAASAPGNQIASKISGTASDSVFAALSDSPLAQLGKDFVAQQVSTYGSKLVNNVDTVVGPVINKVAESYNIALNAIAAAFTAENNLIMFFMQLVAKNAVAALKAKDAQLQIVQAKTQLLQNAITTLAGGGPFITAYLRQLERALALLAGARQELTIVTNTLQGTGRWLSTQYADVQATLLQVEALIQPPSGQQTTQFITSAALSSAGLPSNAQQLTVLLTIPQLVKELTVATAQYATLTLAANALIGAFVLGYGSLQKNAASQVANFSVSTLQNLGTSLDAIIASMATQINGSPTTLSRNPNFTPDQVKTSAAALGWLMQLKSVIAYAKFVPGSALTTISASNTAVIAYNKAVLKIQQENTRQQGGAVLNAFAGEEDTTQILGQVTTFCLASIACLIDSSKVRPTQALGTTLQHRYGLSFTQDGEIVSALTAFINAELGVTRALSTLGGNIMKMLSGFGLDRAAALLGGGNFTAFFGLNQKTATFAGAALVGIAALKNCLETTEQQAQLDDAQQYLQNQLTAKELLANRAASKGYANQVAANNKQSKYLSGIQTKAQKSYTICNPGTTFAQAFTTGIGDVLGTDLTTISGKGII